jgi:hypothetical protein
VQDLYDNISELECIFRAAELPEKVPVGALLGYILTIGNTRLLNPIGSLLWSGKYISSPVQCEGGNESFIGWNRVLGEPMFPFVARLGKLPNFVKNPNPFHNDNKTSVILDYSTDIRKYCPNFEEVKTTFPENVTIQRSPYDKTIAPVNFVVDTMRPVGKTTAGATIFLGLAYFQDMYSEKEIASPFSYFALISYDLGVVPRMKSGQSLKPLVSKRMFPLS